jgi:hypothetical protein
VKNYTASGTKPPKVNLQRSSLLLVMPTGLAVGFGSKEFAYPPFGGIHPNYVGSPVLASGEVRLYSVVRPAYIARGSRCNIHADSAASETPKNQENSTARSTG